MSRYTIASVSCGKDSIVIPYEYIRRGLRLDEVVMYDTGMEFQAIYEEYIPLSSRILGTPERLTAKNLPPHERGRKKRV